MTTKKASKKPTRALPPRMTLYLGEITHAIDARSDGDDGSKSATLRRIVDRYQELVARSIPAFSLDEWHLIVDAMNGSIHDPAAMLHAAPHGVVDAIHLDGLAEKWKVNHVAMCERLKALSFAECAAMVDVSERFWSAVSRDDQKGAEYLISKIAKDL